MTDTVSATLRVTTWRDPFASIATSSSPGGGERALEAGMEPGLLQVVEEVLRLVLEPQDAQLRALLDVGERDALLARAGDDRVPVGARLGVADRGEHALLERWRHRVLEPLGLLVDLVPRDVQDVREEALDQPMAADDLACVLAPRLGERQRLVLGAGDVAVRSRAGRPSRGRSGPRAAWRARCSPR